ncbi:hypothetical protein GCM10011508_07870 [Flavobacterium lutivivi]|nr:hypothetical protein GCM10011508_07870 [Flavobacterium lutivivi]
MKNVITYSRSATDEKVINERTGLYIDPLEYQNESLNEYCSYFNYSVVEHFQEVYRGDTFNRPEWNKLKKLIIERQGKSNAIDSIIIIRPDRFCRNMILSFNELKELSNLGCEVECVEGYIYDNQIRRLNILNRLNEKNKINNMKNVIIYSRVSTDEQANQGYSIEYQEEVLTRHCNLNGYNIVAKFQCDKSGKDFNRPQWKKIKSLVQERRKKADSIDLIIILRPDRFARHLVLALLEIENLLKMGCEVEFLEGEKMDPSNPDSFLVQAIGFALPEIENRKISKRSKEGSHKARLNGCFTGTAPRGYKCVRVGKDATLEFSKDADLIREAFEKMASGLYTADEVRRWLNGQGMKLSKNQFPNIIRNLTYSGKILVRPFGNQPEQIVQGLHPALVSEELFAKANDVLNGRKRNMDFKSDKLNLYPLKGHLYCPTHRRTLSAYACTGRSNKYHYYLCTKPHVKCDRYPVEEVHNQIERILSNIQFSAQLMSSYRTTLEGLFESDDLNRKKSIQKSLDEIEKLNKRRLFVEEQYMDGELPAQEYQDLKNNINTRLFNEKNNLQQLQEVLSPFREYLDKQVPMLEDLVGFYKSVDGKTKNKILGCIFSEKLYFEEKKVATPKFTTPIELLLNASKVLQNCKNKKEVKNDLFSQFAPPLGLEPRTL